MYKISEKNTNGLFSAIADSDIELSAAYIKDIYMEIFDNTQALNGDELDTWTAQVDVSSEEGTDGINAELDKLYDFCEKHGIEFSNTEPKEVKGKLEESASDGWDESLADAAVLYDLQKLIYEIKNGIRGIYTEAYTYAELADYVKRLASRLSNFAEDIKEYEEDGGVNEGLVEKELSTKNSSISKIFVDNKDKINATSSKEELVSVVKNLLKDVNPERTDKIFRALNSKRDYFKALQYIYDFILKGDDLGVIKEDVEAEDDVVVDMFDDFNFDDDIDELIRETSVEECDCGFVPDDTDNIELVDVEEDIERPKEVVHVDACTPDRFKPANPVNFRECKAHNSGPGEVDMEVDGFIPDDTDNIELK